jgi:hypothetical protein
MSQGIARCSATMPFPSPLSFHVHASTPFHRQSQRSKSNPASIESFDVHLRAMAVIKDIAVVARVSLIGVSEHGQLTFPVV